MRITQPRPDEPIRTIQTKRGTRYRVALDVGKKPNGIAGKRRRLSTRCRRHAPWSSRPARRAGVAPMSPVMRLPSTGSPMTGWQAGSTCAR